MKALTTHIVKWGCGSVSENSRGGAAQGLCPPFIFIERFFMGAMKELKRGRRNSVGQGAAVQSSRMAFNELRFVNLDLSPEEKEEFRCLLADGRFDAIPFDDWMGSGFSFKLSMSKDGKSVVATLTCDHREHVCAGGILSAFGGDAATAIAVLRYKDEVLSDELGWFAAADNRSGSRPDIG